MKPMLFIEAVDKTHQQYYPDEINMLKGVVSILGISMSYILSKSLKMKKISNLELFTPGQPCFHKCEECEVDSKPSCEKCKKVWSNCMQYTKNKPYELLRTGMVGGPSIVFCWYHASGIHSHQYADVKICSKVIGFDVNSLYLYCSRQEVPFARKNM